MKIDLHVHTRYSHDATITEEELVHYAKKRGLDGVAITDHDTTEGASRVAEEKDLLIISGIEVSSLHGHIIGLNIREKVPRGLSVEETIERIHDLGGIAVACHPTTPFKGSMAKHLIAKFDAVEVINSSAFPFKYSVKRSMELASALKAPQVAGSDAHYCAEIGFAYTIIEAKPKITSVIQALSRGFCKPFGTAIPLPIRLKRSLRRFRKNF